MFDVDVRAERYRGEVTVTRVVPVDVAHRADVDSVMEEVRFHLLNGEAGDEIRLTLRDGRARQVAA